jgi:AcrR family transcriptional regulator
VIEFSAQAPARPDAVLQKRGVERVHAILDAGEAILAGHGYEAATLKAIGDRAGIPIASVYHYFADRHQVDLAILQRHLQALDEVVRASVDSRTIATMADAVDAVIDPMLTHFRAHPSCVELWFAHQRDQSLTDLVQRYDDETAQMLWEIAIDREFLRKDTPLLVMQLAFETGSRLFDAAFRRSPVGDDTTIAETRRMIVSYLGTHAP